MSSYDSTHTADFCDKCQEHVGKENLHPAPFLYLDRNDTAHPDYMPENPSMKDYKLYWVCAECLERELNSIPKLNDKIPEDKEHEIKRIKI
jgi:hypothetical protein